MTKEQRDDIRKDIKAIRKQCENIIVSFAEIKTYLKETDDQDAQFIKDLRIALNGLEAIMGVFARNKNIDTTYVIEKLQSIESLVSYTREYFEKK